MQFTADDKDTFTRTGNSLYRLFCLSTTVHKLPRLSPSRSGGWAVRSFKIVYKNRFHRSLLRQWRGLVGYCWLLLAKRQRNDLWIHINFSFSHRFFNSLPSAPQYLPRQNWVARLNRVSLWVTPNGLSSERTNFHALNDPTASLSSCLSLSFPGRWKISNIFTRMVLTVMKNNLGCFNGWHSKRHSPVIRPTSLYLSLALGRSFIGSIRNSRLISSDSLGHNLLPRDRT